MPNTSIILRCNNCLKLNRVPVDKTISGPRCGNCKEIIQFPCEPQWVKAAGYDRTVAHWPETLLVEFTAPMCVYCKIFEPVVRKLAREKAGTLKIVQVDTETEEYLVQRFKIVKTPTFIAYKNAVEVIRVDGPPKDKTDLVTWIDNLIGFTSY
jgi:thioredoxin 2